MYLSTHFDRKIAMLPLARIATLGDRISIFFREGHPVLNRLADEVVNG